VGGVTLATVKLIALFTRALGPPVATPEWVVAGNGRLERAPYRVFRWICPVCGAGADDPIYRPLVIDSEGVVCCDASRCSTKSIAAEVRVQLDVCDLLDSLEAA
jgi:hypothetical protein